MIDDCAPMTLKNFYGQPKAVRKLRIHIEAAKLRNTVIEPTLLYGSSGCGKSTLANIIAHEMKMEMRTILCSSISNIGALVDAFISVQENEVVFLDEIHSLTSKQQEVLYPVLEKGMVNSELDGQIIKFNLPKNVVILAATTNIAALATPLRNRFSNSIELTPYDDSFLAQIIKDSCKHYELKIDDDTAMKIASVSRSTPRVAKANLNSIRDYAVVLNDGVIDYDLAKEVFEENGMDIETGLTNADKRYLKFLSKNYPTKSVGIDLLSVSLGEPKAVLENVIESYLLSKEYIVRGAKGRMITKAGIAAVAEEA